MNQAYTPVVTRRPAEERRGSRSLFFNLSSRVSLPRRQAGALLPASRPSGRVSRCLTSSCTRNLFGRLVLFACLPLCALGQDIEAEADTTVLEEVVVTAYQSNRPVAEVPAAIGVVDATVTNRFATTSFVSASNTIPGVRMEERSPGSYRFSIRGSLLRSPFGVRNVKFYWRGLPFTDGGGNTYLNLLDFTSVNSMEIIKGPGSSLYGAGTAGVVLLQPMRMRPYPDVRLGVMGGSYGLWQATGMVSVPAGPHNIVNTSVGFQGSHGYRDHTSMGRINGTLEWSHFEENSTFDLVLFTGQVFYETPGGLTLTQFEEDPRQSRPATAVAPGAVEQNANIHNNTQYLAMSHQSDWNEKWTSSVGVFGSYTGFENPAILNYEVRREGNIGARATIDYHFGESRKHKLTFGSEGQSFISRVEVSANNQGTRGALATADRLKSGSVFGFVQADFLLPRDFYLTVGGSANFLKYTMEREFPVDTYDVKDFKPGLFPRIALLKQFKDMISVYATVSEGFSAPSFAEVLPNTGVYNDLNPERGTSFEGGVKADVFQKQLHAEVAFYDFGISDAIVNVAGGDDYQNAGETSQRGIETSLSWRKSFPKSSSILWGSYSYNNYYFVEYIRGGNYYSGNELTGVPRHVITGGLDVLYRGWYLRVTANHTERIPLNDGNTEYAKEYFLLGARAGKQFSWQISKFDVYAGIDNALDENYSLGNDLNAAGARYYNAAPGRNYYFGVAFSLSK
jgi:iron complex outermembrane receptor protein